jgi:hypothetical protein
MENSVSVKEYTYMILYGNVKQFKCKKLWFLFGEGGFYNGFGDRPSKWPIAKKIFKTCTRN